MTPYIKRHIEKTLKEVASQFPALILTGPRQSGKTTVLKHLFAGTHRYISLDEPDIRLLANKEPRLFLKNYPPPVIIDEIQYAPNLFSYLKIEIDNQRSQKGQFILTGSQIFPLMAHVSESLAGRIAVLSLLSFSFKETLQGTRKKSTSLNYDAFKKRALMGGYPEIVISNQLNPRLWFGSYLQTYLERDVRQMRQIGDLTDFQKLLAMLAAMNGQVLNLSTLSRDMGISVNTIKSWISILEATHQIVLIKSYRNNRGKRLVKSPKVYFLDTGLLCYLNGLTSTEQVFKGPGSGQLFETMILGELIRDAYAQGEIPRIFWWRTSNCQEVNFILEKGGQVIPVEVKLSSRQNEGMVKDLIQFTRLFSNEVKEAYLVNFSDQAILFRDKISFLPSKHFFLKKI